MFFNDREKYEIRHRALLEAIRFCGGVAAYSKRIKVGRSRASNWLNQPEINIPYEYVVLTEDVTQVSIERLSPFTEAANKAIRRLSARDKLFTLDLPLDEIQLGNYCYSDYSKLKQSIIVSTDRVLISGLSELQAQKANGMKKVPVTVLDVGSLILEMRSLQTMGTDLLLSERLAIGLHLEQLLGNGQGYRSDLKKRGTDKPLYNNDSQPCRICDEVPGRKDSKIAQIVGLETKDTYNRVKHVYLHGIPALLQALDEKQISIAMAAKVAKLPVIDQAAYLEKIGIGEGLSFKHSKHH